MILLRTKTVKTMNYDTERKLDGKADKWELQVVRDENRKLSDDISSLKRDMGELSARNSQQRYVIERLLSILANNELLSDMSREMYELQNTV